MCEHEKKDTATSRAEYFAATLMSPTKPIAEIIAKTLRVICENDSKASLIAGAIRGYSAYNLAVSKSKPDDNPNKKLEIFFYEKIEIVFNLAYEILQEELNGVAETKCGLCPIKHRRRNKKRKFSKKANDKK